MPSYINDIGLEPFYTSGDGNCFYNSLAVIMDQGEESSEVYRLGSALFNLAHYEHIVQVVSTPNRRLFYYLFSSILSDIF